MKTMLFMLPLLLMLNFQAKEIYATFDIVAEKTADLAFNYSGIVNNVLVDITTVVKKGETLATLQSDEVIARTNVLKVTLKYAKLDFERFKQLKEKHMIEKSQLDKYALVYDDIKANLELEKVIHAKTILTAPFDGIITEKFVEVGDVVSGQMIKTVFNIQSEHHRKLIIEFDQKYHNDVKSGDKFLYSIDGDETEYSGNISKIYPKSNAHNRKMKAEVYALDFTVGLFGEGVIITQNKEQ